MGTITTGTGLISGIDTANLIDQLMQLEARGKNRLERRVATLQSQQSALMDINARLLNLKNVMGSFRQQSVFDAARATSSNEDILTASASNGAQPGNVSFTVKQLVAASQKMSRGFNDPDTSPIGLTSLTFDFGQGRLNRDRPLEELNGGEGVNLGNIQITDQAGNQGTIDLTDVASINEAIERINASADVAIEAKLSGDGIVVTDTSGGDGSLIIANAIGSTTATDLGIAGSSIDGVITGSSINYLNNASSLSGLNDGTGVLIRNNVNDLQIVDRNGTTHNIDLGRINADIDTDTPLSELNNGSGVTISDDSDNPDITFIARDGTEFEVNLTGVSTVGGLINRVNSETDGHIQLSVTDGNKLTVTDTVGGAGDLRVEGAGINNTQTAEDLGILNTEGVSADSFAGETIPNTITDPQVTTIDGLIARIEEQTNGAITASLNEAGTRLIFSDNTGGDQNLIIRSTAGNPHLADQLGINTGNDGVAQNEVTGQRLIADLGSVLVRHLNGGNGLDGAQTLDITDRAGNQMQVGNLGNYQSLSEIIDAINAQAASEGVGITAQLNDARTGLIINDTSGGAASNLIIGGDAAAALGIEADAATNTVRGTHLNHQYVTEASRLSDLNYGRGVSAGSFRITDGRGKSAVVNITDNHDTLYDVIQAINSRGIGVKARINDTGDGLILEEDPDELGGEPFTAMKVEAVSGSTARDLNIVGTSKTVSDASINGGYRRTVEFEETATLNTIVSEINKQKIPVSASVINAGSGSKPYRLNFSSEITGLKGDLVIDSGDFDLGLTTLSKAQDAKIMFGGAGQEGSFLITSSTNSVKDVVPGVTLDLKKASDETVNVSVQRDVDGIVEEAGKFVEAFNEVISRINEYDFFDVEEERRGILLGNSTTARVREVLYRTIRQQAEGVDGQYQFLRQVGIRIGEGGKLDFDEQRFRDAYDDDPEAVKNLFAAHETVPTPAEEIFPGVTVGGGGQTTTVRGIGEIFNDLLEGLTDSIDGTFARVEQNFTRQIDLVKGRIEAFDIRLESRRKALERQFTAMETTLAQLQSQGNALTSLSLNMLQLQGRRAF